MSKANQRSFMFNRMNQPEIDFSRPLNLQPEEVVRKILPNMMRTQIRSTLSNEALRKGGMLAKCMIEQHGPPHMFITISMCEFKSPIFYESLIHFQDYQEPIFDDPNIKSFDVKAFKMK